MYLLWSYLPSPFLHRLGIHYYPDRWWSLAIPSFLVMSIVYIYIALASYNNGYLTLALDSIENIVDDTADIAILDREKKINRKRERAARFFSHHEAAGMRWATFWSEGTDAVMDIPVGGVCRILYGQNEPYAADVN